MTRDGLFAKRLARKLAEHELEAVAGGVIMDNITLKHSTCGIHGGGDGAYGESDGIIVF